MILIKGIMTGLILSFPFGPVGIYCMEKAMIEGEKKAYISALGMVSVDIIYGIISFLFLYQIESYVIKFENPLKILISLFLIVIGGKKLFGKTEIKEVKDNHFTMIQDYFETFFLAVFNISSVFVIAGIYTLLNILDEMPTKFSTFQLAIGIGLGGAVLWFITLTFIHYFKRILTLDLILKISKFSGAVIMIFGIGTIIFAFYK